MGRKRQISRARRHRLGLFEDLYAVIDKEISREESERLKRYGKGPYLFDIWYQVPESGCPQHVRFECDPDYLTGSPYQEDVPFAFWVKNYHSMPYWFRILRLKRVGKHRFVPRSRQKGFA